MTRFLVEIRPVHRCSRWAWYAIDRVEGGVLEYELEFESPAAARRATMARLRELLATSLDPHPGRIDTMPWADGAIAQGGRLDTENVATRIVIEVRPDHRRLRWAWYAIDRTDGSVLECEFE